MSTQSKMISARLPAALVARLDYVVRNSDPAAVKNRSVAMHMALETWLPNEELRLVNLGVLPKKAAR